VTSSAKGDLLRGRRARAHVAAEAIADVALGMGGPLLSRLGSFRYASSRLTLGRRLSDLAPCAHKGNNHQCKEDQPDQEDLQLDLFSTSSPGLT